MENCIYHFVNVEEKSVDQDNSSPRNHSEDEDGLRLSASYDSGVTEPLDSTLKPKYYRLDQVVFAEPINEVLTAAEESGAEDAGEITFVDNIMVKRRHGKRNRYFIDIKDGCLDCPMTNCSQTFATKTLLKAHIRKVHCATVGYTCEECGAGFTAPYLLRRHSAVHAGRKVQCAVCGKWLSQRTDLSAHMRTHGAPQHECAACGKRFVRLASLRRHELFVHRDRDGDIACDRCDARFDSDDCRYEGEGLYDEEERSVSTKKGLKKRVNSNRSDSEETVVLKKRKAVAPKKSGKTRDTGVAVNPVDLFGLVTAEESTAAALHSQSQGDLPSVLNSRVANGTVSRRKPVHGEFYVEVKVYRTCDAVSTRPEERWQKALTSLKIQINPDGDEWRQLQGFFKTIRKSMDDVEPVFYGNKIN